MDLEELVTESKKLLREFERSWGPVSLFMLVANDIPAWLGWSLVVSAKGLDQSEEESRRAYECFGVFRRSLPPELQRLLLSLSLKPTTDPFVRELVFMFGSQKPVVHVQSWYVAGQQLPQAMILKSKKIAA